MTNEELEETAFELLAVIRSLQLHKVSANAIYSLRTKDRELFGYHVSTFLEVIYDTLNDELNFLEEIAERLLKAEEDGQ